MTPQEQTMQYHVDFMRSRYPDAYADQYALHSWVIRSRLCGQIGLFRKTEAEAWQVAYELRLQKEDKKLNHE